MSFDGLIASAKEMKERLAKGKAAGLAATGAERVTPEELENFERGAQDAVLSAFGNGSSEAAEWFAVVAKKDGYVSAAIAANPGPGAFDGYIDYLNLAQAKLQVFADKVARRPASLTGYVMDIVHRLPRPLRRASLIIGVVVASAIGAWQILPSRVQDDATRKIAGEHPIVSIIAQMSERTEPGPARSFPVSETNDSHDAFETNTKRYSKRFPADDGYRITAHSWKESSATRVLDLSHYIEQGGRAVVMSFGLKAGPKTDRYRGWLHGQMEITQERSIPARSVDVVRAWKASPGATYTSAIDLGAADSLEVRDGAGTLVTTGRLGELISVSGVALSVQKASTGVGFVVKVQQIGSQ